MAQEEKPKIPVCPECGVQMKKLPLPPEAGYDTEFYFVCFNDDCPYFVRGWKWMWDHYCVRSSYRMRIDPLTGKSAPFPVWSKDAMKNRILE